jgi:hypothetical protein
MTAVEAEVPAPAKGEMRVCMRVALLLSLLLAGIARLDAAELWDFLHVGIDHKAGSKWAARSGTASIDLQGNRLEIRASYNEDGTGRAAGPAAMVISGTVEADQSIKATCTVLNTDRHPFQLSGRYITRSDVQVWGTTRKIVTHREIVFAHPPNPEFFGFLADDVRTE